MVVDASGSTDADNDPLTYRWEVPSQLKADIDGARVSFIAAEYDLDTSLLFTVNVSDSKANSVASATVVVAQKGTGGGQCDNLWDENTTYNGGDKVTWDQREWQAKWWTRGDNPSQSGPWGVWEELGPANCSTN